MSQRPAISAFFAACADRGDKVGFSLIDGREFLGWVYEVSDEQILVLWASNPIYAQAHGGERWNPDDEWMPLETIRTETVARYDQSRKQWLHMTD
ncbi:hypothetical protein [Phytohabitans rumicis]|uniref:Uncharacterized protein n=1 Tax=Phytohabitans rumicis TaxID=1076125 RepID=A0A6V8LLI6_9ACTN|nr:hypothetical protein [Phytohabitans rumicis]GFJ93505.1 hypothetical protein Prum_071470 [Phytohabitans rumicis]